MVEQNSITSEDAISLSVVDGDPVSIELGSTFKGRAVEKQAELVACNADNSRQNTTQGHQQCTHRRHILITDAVFYNFNTVNKRRGVCGGGHT